MQIRQKQKMWVNFRFGIFFILFFVFLNCVIIWTFTKEGYANFFSFAQEHPALCFFLGWLLFICLAVFFCFVRIIIKYIYVLKNR